MSSNLSEKKTRQEYTTRLYVISIPLIDQDIHEKHIVSKHMKGTTSEFEVDSMNKRNILRFYNLVVHKKKKKFRGNSICRSVIIFKFGGFGLKPLN